MTQQKSNGVRGLIGAVVDGIREVRGAQFPAMSPIDFLKQQHRMVDALFAKIEASDGRARQSLFDELLTALAIHAELEEQVFYPMLRDSAEDKILEAAEEHLVVKRLLADLIDLEPSDPVFAAKIQVLKESVHHHVREEELLLMPLANRVFDDDMKEAVLEEMVALDLQLREQGGMEESVAAATDEAAPI